MTKQPSDTPRTDAVTKLYNDRALVHTVPSDFARQLERELNEALALEKDYIKAVELERDQLRAELHETQGAVMAMQLRCGEWREVAGKLYDGLKSHRSNISPICLCDVCDTEKKLLAARDAKGQP